MGLPSPLSRKLRDTLGKDAAELLVTWLEEMRAQHKAELARIDRRFDGFEERMDRIDERFDRIDERFDRIDKRFDRIDERFDGVDQRITGLEVRIADVRADLMKWSFVFWCGAVAAIAALAGVLRN